MTAPAELADGQLHVVVFGDGEGESIVVCVPPTTWLVVDSMHWRGTSRNPAVELLDAHHTTWSAIVLTHPHVDHATGFDELIRHGGRGPVGCAIPPLSEHEDADSFAERYRTAEAIKAVEAIQRYWGVQEERGEQPWNFALALDTISVGPLDIEPLWPGPGISTDVEPTQFNRLSTALRIEWERVHLLLGADLPGACWGQLVSTHGCKLADNEMLKAAHHGSRTNQHPGIVLPVPQHRVTTAKAKSRLPDFREDHGVQRLLSGANQLHCTTLSFAYPNTSLTRIEGQQIQYPSQGRFGTTVPLPSPATAPESWHACTFDDSGGVTFSSGSAARYVTS